MIDETSLQELPEDENFPYNLTEREFCQHVCKELADNLFDKFDRYIDSLIKDD